MISPMKNDGLASTSPVDSYTLTKLIGILACLCPEGPQPGIMPRVGRRRNTGSHFFLHVVAGCTWESYWSPRIPGPHLQNEDREA